MDMTSLQRGLGLAPETNCELDFGSTIDSIGVQFLSLASVGSPVFPSTFSGGNC